MPEQEPWQPVTKEITAAGKTEAARKGRPQRRPRGSAGIGHGAYSQQHGILCSAELVSRVDLTLNALTTKIKETKTNHKGDSRKLLDVLDVYLDDGDGTMGVCICLDSLN